MLYQYAMDGFEDDIELNMQLGLAPMKVEDWFEPFNGASCPVSPNLKQMVPICQGCLNLDETECRVLSHFS